MIETTIPLLTYIAGISTALAAALVGNFLVIRKMVLVSDSMPHIALPGVALGIVYAFNPLLGAAVALALAVLLIWQIETRTDLSLESIIGVLFVASLALGGYLIPEEELLEAFFGTISTITPTQALVQIVVSLGLFAVLLFYFRTFVLASIAPDLARAEGTHVESVEFFFLVALAIVVSLGINFVGVLLMSSLLIIPSVTARNLASDLRRYVGYSGAIGVIAVSGGLYLSGVAGIAPGIAIVFVSVLSFLVSLGYRFTLGR